MQLIYSWMSMHDLRAKPQISTDPRTTSVLVFVCSLSHKLLPNLQEDTASHVNDIAGRRVSLLSAPSSPPSLCLFCSSRDRRRIFEKVQCVSLARSSSHYEVLSTSQQHYTSIIQRH